MLDIVPELQNIGLAPFIQDGKALALAGKIGGDNMGLLNANAQIMQILGKQDVTQTYAVSAFRSSKIDFNTTGKLIETGESLKHGNSFAAYTQFQEVVDFHTTLIQDILKNTPDDIRESLLSYSQELFEEYKNILHDARSETSAEGDYIISGNSGRCSLLSLGEIVAAKLMVRYLELIGIPAEYVDTENIDFGKEQSIDICLQNFLQQRLRDIFSNNTRSIPIIPGYIGNIPGGILKVLGRGYTDYTGAQAAISLYDMKQFDQVLLYIQKLYGFKSTDPRMLEEETRAKTVSLLSYDLTQRAISHRGAGAGLINPHALNRDIMTREIPILVGNPTDESDIAIINTRGCEKSQGVQLVLSKAFNEDIDGRNYGMTIVSGKEFNTKQIVYLMGENIGNIATIYSQVVDILRKYKIESIAGEIVYRPKAEMSFVFSDEASAKQAQKILHRYFIEQ